MSTRTFTVALVCPQFAVTIAPHWKKKCLNLGLVLARFELYQDIATAFSSVEDKIEGILSEEHFGVWVGATDRYDEERIVWEDNYDKVELTMFDHALPTGYNNDSNDCAVMDKFYLLVMEDCYQEHYVFCMEDSLSWFDDKHLCRCRNSICNEYFECDRYKCTAYWFDEACQYRDLLSDANVVLFSLVDNDDETCVANVPSPLVLKFQSSHFFTWLKISFHEPDQAKGINISFLSSGTPKECLGRRDLDEEFMKVIYCFLGETMVDSVTLSWQHNKYICSLFVNGGKNIALNAKTSQTGNDSASSKEENTSKQPSMSQLAVDGEEGYLSQCTLVNNPGLQIWQLTFDKEYLVYEILLYRRRGLSNYTHMAGFRLLCFDEKNLKVFEYQDQDNAHDAVVKISIGNLQPILNIQVELDTKSKKNKKKYIELCEVQVFGDCAPPVYGTFCDKECHLFCKGQVCMSNDECLYCALGNVTKDCRPTDERITPPAPVKKTTRTTTTEAATRAPLTELLEWQKFYFLLFLVASLLLVVFIAVIIMVYLQIVKKSQPKQKPIIIVRGRESSDESLENSSSETESLFTRPSGDLSEFTESSQSISTKV